MLPKLRSNQGERNRSLCGSSSQSAVCLKLNHPAAQRCFLQCTLYLCVYPHSSVQKPLCTDLAFFSCILLAVALFGFLSSSADLLLLTCLPASLFLSFWMQSSLCKLLISVFFPLSLLPLPCFSGCWIKPELGHRLLPPGTIGKIKVGTV